MVTRRVLVITDEEWVDPPLRDAINRAFHDSAVETRAFEELPPDLTQGGWDLVVTSPAGIHRLVNGARAAALEEAERVQDKLLATLFHELRTPLTPILAWAQLLQRTTEVGRIRQGADTIVRNVRSLNAMVEDVLDIRRIARGVLRLDVRPTDLNAAIGRAITAVHEAAAEKRIQLEVVEAEAITAEVDAARVEQAITYILTNAIRFTQTEGTVRLALHRTSDSAVIVVHDDGPPLEETGIPSTVSVGPGPDLGARNSGVATIQLALALALAALHGGSIEAASANNGINVSLRLPLPGHSAMGEV